MAKIESGKVTVQGHDFDLHRLLREVAEIFQMRAREKHLQLSVTHEADVPRFVYADGGKLRQILINYSATWSNSQKPAVSPCLYAGLLPK